MKYSIGILTTITLIAAFALLGCESNSRKMDETGTSVNEVNRDLETAKSEVEAELQIFRTENAERIAEFDRKISEIKQRIENESDSEVKQKLEEKLNSLEATYRDLKRKMDNYQASGRENWGEFKDSFSNSMDDLGDSLENFFSPSRTTTSKN